MMWEGLWEIFFWHLGPSRFGGKPRLIFRQSGSGPISWYPMELMWICYLSLADCLLSAPIKLIYIKCHLVGVSAAGNKPSWFPGDYSGRPQVMIDFKPVWYSLSTSKSTVNQSNFTVNAMPLVAYWTERSSFIGWIDIWPPLLSRRMHPIVYIGTIVFNLFDMEMVSLHWTWRLLDRLCF